MKNFKVLAGLPGNGDLPKQFSSTGLGSHREGFVVEFLPQGRPAWVGNFQGGLSSFSTAVEHPDGSSVVVVAGRDVYVVDPEDQDLVESFGGDFVSLVQIPEKSMLLFGSSIDFEAIGPTGRLWRSRRISWDGIKDIKLNAETLTGEEWSYEDIWIPFSLDINTGRHTGGPQCPP
ncbi:MAG: hypothetical protein PSX80_06340 [bacterium]|nr:hypothetical protein [bacterium]